MAWDKPDIIGLGPKIIPTINPSSLTSGSVENIFDGLANPSYPANTCYLAGGTLRYIDLTIEKEFNLYAQVHAVEASYFPEYRIEKWNGSAFESFPAKCLITYGTKTANSWHKIFNRVPAGRYRFFPSGSYPNAVIGEWFLEEFINPLTEKTSLSDLEVGDCISCDYVSSTSGVVGTFSNLGSASKNPLINSATPDGKFYFIMVGYDYKGRKKLIADRPIQHSISWETLNDSKVVFGGNFFEKYNNRASLEKGYKISSHLLTGGLTASDKMNEWDKIIGEHTLGGRITAGSDDIWNYTSSQEFTSTTHTSGISTRVTRGLTLAGYNAVSVSSILTTVSFRPMILIEQNGVTLIFKNKSTEKFLYLDGENVLESPAVQQIGESAQQKMIIEYIKQNAILTDVFQTGSNLTILFAQSNKILELKNYNVPDATSKINSIVINGQNILCAIKKDTINYCFKNGVWVEQSDPVQWNTITEINSLTPENLALLLNNNEFKFSLYFIDSNSLLNDISITVNTNGYYAFANENSYDLTISNNNEMIEFKNYQAGTYKVAYITGTEQNASVINYLGVVANENKEILFTEEVNYENIIVTTLILKADEDNVEKVISDLSIDEANFNEIGEFVKDSGKFKNKVDYEVDSINPIELGSFYCLEYPIISKELIEVE